MYQKNFTFPNDFLNVRGVTFDHTWNAFLITSSVTDLLRSFIGYFVMAYVKSFLDHLLPACMYICQYFIYLDQKNHAKWLLGLHLDGHMNPVSN